MRHLLEIDDLAPRELVAVLDLASHPSPARALEGKGAALIFEKPSARTRNSTEMAVTQLGGHPVYIQGSEVGLDVRETVEDVTNTMACYHDVVCARVFEHSTVERMAAVDVVPVVNLLSDGGHPMQALADILTLKGEFGDLSGRTVTYVGDSNNVTRSLALAANAFGMAVRVASPEGYHFGDDDLGRLRAAGVDLYATTDPVDAVAGADAVYTDVWTSMGQEAETAARLEAFRGFCVDETLMTRAADHAIFMHCLPAHRGEECTDEVLTADNSRIWPQAANRMHSARGLLAWLCAPEEPRLRAI